MTFLLNRFDTGDQGTFGELFSPEGGHLCFVGELPDRANRVGRSRIPAGGYEVVAHRSPRFGRCWYVLDVPGRSFILIHRGNFVGDVDKGFKAHSQGCLLPGSRCGRLGSQRAVLASGAAFARLQARLPDRFTLTIGGI